MREYRIRNHYGEADKHIGMVAPKSCYQGSDSSIAALYANDESKNDTIN